MLRCMENASCLKPTCRYAYVTSVIRRLYEHSDFSYLDGEWLLYACWTDSCDLCRDGPQKILRSHTYRCHLLYCRTASSLPSHRVAEWMAGGEKVPREDLACMRVRASEDAPCWRRSAKAARIAGFSDALIGCLFVTPDPHF